MGFNQKVDMPFPPKKRQHSTCSKAHMLCLLEPPIMNLYPYSSFNCVFLHNALNLGVAGTKRLPGKVFVRL